MRRCVVGLFLAVVVCVCTTAFAFDHSHAAWDALVRRNVVVATDGNSSKVDYAAFKRERDALERYLNEVSSVAASEYDGWTREQKLAFLINAYNAFTIKLVLTRY